VICETVRLLLIINFKSSHPGFPYSLLHDLATLTQPELLAVLKRLSSAVKLDKRFRNRTHDRGTDGRLEMAGDHFLVERCESVPLSQKRNKGETSLEVFALLAICNSGNLNNGSGWRRGMNIW
jgi:hypothetical protein